MYIGDPQSFNGYSYVQNDPVNFVDPTGLLPILVCFWGPSHSDGRSEWTCVVLDVPEPQGPRDPRGGGREGPQNPARSQPYPCDTSSAAVKAAAQKVANKIPGTTLGVLNREPVINFSGNFDQTVAQLKNAGYYTGILAFNPIDHPGGQEFRTYGSPGFHFKVVYPQTKAVPVSPNSPEFKEVKVNKPALGTDLHIDCNNPVGSGASGTIKHGVDFARDHIPWWIFF